MYKLIVSLNENHLKLSVSDTKSFRSISAELDSGVANDSEILNPQIFSEVLFNLIKEATQGSKSSHKNTSLHFLVEPQDVYFHFITVNKKNGDVDEQIINDIRNKLDKVSLDELYFSYQKIAPFVYQFIGIKKEKLDMYLDVSRALGYELKAVVPWLMLLPRYVGNNEPCILLSKSDADQIVALSELNGIFFCEVFDKERSPQDLAKMVSQISVYKRPSPITKIYSLNGDSFSLDPNFLVKPLIPQEEITEQLKGYEMHALYNKMIEEDPTLLTSQLNALGYLPVPVVQTEQKSPVVYAGAALALILLVGLGYLFFFKDKSTQSPQVANSGSVTSEVLSETQESTVSVEPTPIEEKPELKKEDIKIRIENAAGIPGLAAKTKQFFQDKGWVVPEIDTANESGRTDTLIRIKPSKKDYLELLKTDTQGSYEIITEETLAESAEYDALILVGSK